MRVIIKNDGSVYVFPVEQNGFAIYRITNRLNGLCYIGQTKQDVTIRWSQHRHGMDKNSSIYKAIQDFGANNFIFELLATDIYDDFELDKIEAEYIAIYNSFECGYNETRGNIGKITTLDEIIERQEVVSSREKRIANNQKIVLELVPYKDEQRTYHRQEQIDLFDELTARGFTNPKTGKPYSYQKRINFNVLDNYLKVVNKVTSSELRDAFGPYKMIVPLWEETA